MLKSVAKEIWSIGALLFTSIACSLCLVGIAVAEPRAMSAVDFIELPRLSSPTVSPDGERVIYRRSEIAWAENEDVNRLRSVDLKSGEVHPVLKASEPDESFGGVVWANGRDGFLVRLERGADVFKQVYFYDFADDSLTRLTEHHEDVRDVTWAPRAEGFYFRSDSARSQGLSEDIEEEWIIEEYDAGQMGEVWYYDWASGKTAHLLGGEFHVRNYQPSHDGSKLLYSRADHTLEDRQDAELWLYDVASASSIRLTDNAYVESRATLSPDNRAVAYIATVNTKGAHYYEDNIFIQEVGASNAELILPKLPMEMTDVQWDRSGAGLFILGNTGVRTQLYHYSVESRQLVAITAGDSEVKEWSYNADLDTHVFVNADASGPGEVWLLKANESRPRQVSSEFAGIADQYLLPRQRVFSWRGRGSVALEGILVYPLNFQEGTPFPLVTITHGGPRASSQFGTWRPTRYIPVLAGENYGVFFPNHRGGTGYGDRFMRDMVGKYFNHAHLDVLDGIDALVAEGLADPDQLIKMGWSAGGHMTNKLITYTDRFRAASSGAGAADWVSVYGESDRRFNRTFWFGSAPWEKNARLRSYARQSLLKDAWRVKTPTLFFAGAEDVRVPPTQAIMMYQGVKAAGADVRLYLAPGEPHKYQKPTYRLFKINTELAWFAQHLGREPYVKRFPKEKNAEQP